MVNKNALYNRDVAEIFVALTQSLQTEIQDMSEKEMIALSNAAKELSANKPQAY
jgi:hypothetical protein